MGTSTTINNEIEESHNIILSLDEMIGMVVPNGLERIRVTDAQKGNFIRTSDAYGSNFTSLNSSTVYRIEDVSKIDSEWREFEIITEKGYPTILDERRCDAAYKKI